MIDTANSVLIFSFVLAGYGAWAAVMGGRWGRKEMVSSAERTTTALFLLCTLLIGILVVAFITRDFSLSYVASYSSRTLPLVYTISAVWAGQAGSLLLWTWLLCLFSVIVVRQNRWQNRTLMPYVLGTLLTATFFFIGLMVYGTNPFEQLPQPVADGRGMNPMLQNSGMIMHPPTLYLGYVGFTVPFAFALAALITGKLDAQWIRTTRRWTLFSWIFLTLGNLFGAKWAYVELGWGGYWAWDPVENASLMPWLTGTAFLHSVMIQEKRGMLKVWNMVLIILTFCLTIFGTFITRSGIISSVHSFGESNLGPLFLLFLGVVMVISFSLLGWRRKDLASENHLDAFLSRESSFLFNNLILVGMTFAVFWGTIFPIVSEAVRGVKITVGPPFFNQVNLPIALALLALTGICPLIAWRKSSAQNFRRNFVVPVAMGFVTALVLTVAGLASFFSVVSFSLAVFVTTTIVLEFYRGARARARIREVTLLHGIWDVAMRNKRRYGGYIVHLGVVMVFVGITGSSVFQREKIAVLSPGEQVEIGDYTLRYETLEDHSTDHSQVVAARVSATQGGRSLGTLYPAKEFHANFEPVSEVDIRQTLREDFYVILAGWDQEMRATLKVLVIPLVGWIWLGGTVMIVGTLVAMGPDRLRVKRKAVARRGYLPRRRREVSVA
ncbi:MAG: heme lyase CcmF/NrfE family subunit [Fidelibacterota bacterium]